MLKKIVVSVLLLCGIGVVAYAAQVTSSEYVRQYSLGNRSDGWFQRTDSHGFDLHINGYRLQSSGKAVYEDFTEYGDGDDACMQADLTACSVATTETNVVMFPSGNRAVVYNNQQQDVYGVDMDAGSLDISGDQTNNDGLEMVLGVPGASGGPFIIGEDPAFYVCARLAIADVTGTDDLAIGFRRLEPFTANVDDYNDMAAMNIISGNITIETIDDNAGTTSTDTTDNWADLATKTVCVYVSAAGVVTYKIDGNPPTTTAAFTFDDSDPVIPFIYLLQDADLTGEVDLYEWEVGYQ